MQRRPSWSVARLQIICSMPRTPIMAARPFFESLGFHRVEPEVLATALQNLAREAEVAQASVSPHGRKYVIVGQIESPIGKAASVQTIWIVDKGSDVARLVTAYPRKV